MVTELFGNLGTVLLEVEINPDQKNNFEQRYFDITGELPPGNEHYQTQYNKWGIEYRIYFEGDADSIAQLVDNGYHVENRASGYRADFNSRINNKELFWEMVKEGYRIGFNN